MTDHHDPALRAAMHDIRLILARYDVGGCVVLGSRTHNEFADMQPGWSTVRAGSEGTLQIKLSEADRDIAEASVGYVLAMRDMLAMFSREYRRRAEAVIGILKRHGVDVYHEPFCDGIAPENGKARVS